MLNKNTFIDGLNSLLLNYSNWNFDKSNKKALQMWYKHFEHMENERFLYMVDAYIGYSERYPTIAGLKKCDTMPRKSKTQLEHERALAEHHKLKEKEKQDD